MSASRDFVNLRSSQPSQNPVSPNPQPKKNTILKSHGRPPWSAAFIRWPESLMIHCDVTAFVILGMGWKEIGYAMHLPLALLVRPQRARQSRVTLVFSWRLGGSASGKVGIVHFFRCCSRP